MESADAKVMHMQPVGPGADGDWKKPWIAYHITNRPGMKGRVWSRIGTAWLNRDGSISLLLEAIPQRAEIADRICRHAELLQSWLDGQEKLGQPATSV